MEEHPIKVDKEREVLKTGRTGLLDCVAKRSVRHAEKLIISQSFLKPMLSALYPGNRLPLSPVFRSHG